MASKAEGEILKCTTIKLMLLYVPISDGLLLQPNLCHLPVCPLETNRRGMSPGKKKKKFEIGI
jgi:hypothetical protein